MRRSRFPLLIKGVPHVKAQTGIACTGTLALNEYYLEYSCISCGWCADARPTVERLRALRALGMEVILYSDQTASQHSAG